MKFGLALNVVLLCFAPFLTIASEVQLDTQAAAQIQV